MITWKDVQNWFHSLVSHLKPALDFAESKGGQDALILAETLLAGVAAGTPWAAVSASLITIAKAKGIELALGDASILLNLAKANLDAKAAMAALAPAPAAPAAS